MNEGMSAIIRCRTIIPAEVTPQQLFDLGVQEGREDVRRMVIAIVKGHVHGVPTNPENYSLRLAMLTRREQQTAFMLAKLQATNRSLEDAIQQLNDAHTSNAEALRQELSNEKCERVHLQRLVRRLNKTSATYKLATHPPLKRKSHAKKK